MADGNSNDRRGNYNVPDQPEAANDSNLNVFPEEEVYFRDVQYNDQSNLHKVKVLNHPFADVPSVSRNRFRIADSSEELFIRCVNVQFVNKFVVIEGNPHKCSTRSIFKCVSCSCVAIMRRESRISVAVRSHCDHEYPCPPISITDCPLFSQDASARSLSNGGNVPDQSRVPQSSSLVNRRRSETHVSRQMQINGFDGVNRLSQSNQNRTRQPGTIPLRDHVGTNHPKKVKVSCEDVAPNEIPAWMHPQPRPQVPLQQEPIFIKHECLDDVIVLSDDECTESEANKSNSDSLVFVRPSKGWLNECCKLLGIAAAEGIYHIWSLMKNVELAKFPVIGKVKRYPSGFALLSAILSASEVYAVAVKERLNEYFRENYATLGIVGGIDCSNNLSRGYFKAVDAATNTLSAHFAVVSKMLHCTVVVYTYVDMTRLIFQANDKQAPTIVVGRDAEGYFLFLD